MLIKRCMTSTCRITMKTIGFWIHNTNFAYLFCCLDFFFRQILGRILVFFVHAILLFFGCVVFGIVVPYESLHLPFWLLCLLILVAIYLFVNILYHYRKASSIEPGTPPKTTFQPMCRHCSAYKPAMVHHCAICNKCIINMDHHCVWVNQCVGAKNHRHFFQFLAFMIAGCLIFVLAGYHTFYFNYWKPNSNQVFCHSDLGYLPWYEFLCFNHSEAIMSSIFFTYFLCILVFFLVGGLCYWNFVLISYGQTYIGILQNQVPVREMLKIIAFPHRNPNFKENWRRFLGLTKSRTFARHILLPSAHQAYSSSDPRLDEHSLIEALVV